VLIRVPAAGLAGDLHQLISNFLIAFIVAHILGVAVDWFLPLGSIFAQPRPKADMASSSWRTSDRR
jgi:hypothetical protein